MYVDKLSLRSAKYFLNNIGLQFPSSTQTMEYNYLPMWHVPNFRHHAMSHYIPQKPCMWLLIQILKSKRGRWNEILFVLIIGSEHKVRRDKRLLKHYGDVIMGAIASRITSLTIVYPTVCSDADQRKHQSSVSLAFVWGPVNSAHKWPVTRIFFPFDYVIMKVELH